MSDEEQKSNATYRSYLVRLRLVDNAGQPVWRATLQVPGSIVEHHFGSLGELCAYLEEQVDAGSKEDGI